MRVRCTQLHGPSLLLLGDTGHAVSPSTGNGMNSALEDAWLLGQVGCLAPHAAAGQGSAGRQRGGGASAAPLLVACSVTTQHRLRLVAQLLGQQQPAPVPPLLAAAGPEPGPVHPAGTLLSGAPG